MQNSNGKECLHGKEKVADKQGSEKKNRKEYHLECCTVCNYVIMYAADIETDGNLKEKVRSF